MLRIDRATSIVNENALTEDPKILMKYTNLPVDIWMGPKEAAHGPRIKFQANKNQRTTKEYSSMTISDSPQIENPPKKFDIDKKTIDLISAFVVANKDLLTDFYFERADFDTDVLPNLKQVDENGNIIEPMKLLGKFPLTYDLIDKLNKKGVKLNVLPSKKGNLIITNKNNKEKK